MDIQAASAAFNAQSRMQGWEQLCDPELAFEHGDFAAVRALWAEQARGRALPARTDMTARVLKTFLPNIGLKERVETNPSRYRWRLMGTKVAQILGERTGKFAEEDAPAPVAARWVAGCDLVLDVCLPLRFVGRVMANGKDFLFSELLFMPLAGDDGAPRFVMGFSHYGTQRLSHGTTAFAQASARR